jgi:hypothetical protein
MFPELRHLQILAIQLQCNFWGANSQDQVG